MAHELITDVEILTYKISRLDFALRASIYVVTTYIILFSLLYLLRPIFPGGALITAYLLGPVLIFYPHLTDNVGEYFRYPAMVTAAVFYGLITFFLFVKLPGVFRVITVAAWCYLIYASWVTLKWSVAIAFMIIYNGGSLF